MTDKVSETVEYGVARKGSTKIIGDTFDTPERAQRHLDWVAGQYAALGDETEVRLVYVDVTVTRSTPKVYTPPQPEEPATEAPADVPPSDSDASA